MDGGASADFGLVQYTHDGKPDPMFGQAGIVTTDFNGGSDDVINGLVIDGVGGDPGGGLLDRREELRLRGRQVPA